MSKDKKPIHVDFINVSQMKAWGEYVAKRRETQPRSEVIRQTCGKKSESGRKNPHPKPPRQK